MAREDIGPIRKAEIDFAIARLEAFAMQLKQLQNWYERHNQIEELWIWRYKSLERGLVALEALPKEFVRAMHAQATGNPQSERSSKARSSKKVVDDKLAQADRAIAASKKRAKPKE